LIFLRVGTHYIKKNGDDWGTTHLYNFGTTHSQWGRAHEKWLKHSHYTTMTQHQVTIGVLCLGVVSLLCNVSVRITLRDPYTWAPPHCEWELYQSCDGIVNLSFPLIKKKKKKKKKKNVAKIPDKTPKFKGSMVKRSLTLGHRLQECGVNNWRWKQPLRVN
jgi:hypothetical protein